MPSAASTGADFLTDELNETKSSFLFSYSENILEAWDQQIGRCSAKHEVVYPIPVTEAALCINVKKITACIRGFSEKMRQIIPYSTPLGHAA